MLHVLKELNLGRNSLEQQTERKLLLGNDFDWSQFKVFFSRNSCLDFF